MKKNCLKLFLLEKFQVPRTSIAKSFFFEILAVGYAFHSSTVWGTFERVVFDEKNPKNVGRLLSESEQTVTHNVVKPD